MVNAETKSNANNNHKFVSFLQYALKNSSVFWMRNNKIVLRAKEILMQLSELVLLKKLGLSQKFLREMSHARKSVLRVGLTKLSTIIVSLVMQLCLGHIRNDDDIAKIIRANVENESF